MMMLRIYVLSSLDHLLLHLVFDLSAYDRLFQQQLGLKGFLFYLTSLRETDCITSAVYSSRLDAYLGHLKNNPSCQSSHDIDGTIIITAYYYYY